MLFSRWRVHMYKECLWTYIFFPFIFLIYMATPNLLVWGDTIANRYLPISLIREANFDLNEFDFPYDKEIPYFLQYRNGRLISSYPVGAVLTALPFYLVPVLLGISHQSSWIPLLEKLSAASIAVFSVLFLYLMLRHLATAKNSLIVTSIYALCTSTFSISSQALWQHGPSQFLLTVGLYFLIRGLHEERFISWSGFPLSAAVICRPTDVLMVLPILIYLLCHRRKFILLWIIYALPPVIFVITYNYRYFGSVFESGYGFQVLHPSSSYWSTPFLYGLLGVLISPSKGLILYSPVLLFAFWGMAYVWKINCEPLIKYLSLGPLLVLILYSKWHFWWGGETYGPRLVADITPILCLYIYVIFKIIDQSYIHKLIFIIMIMMSFLIHTIGAFGFDSSWYKKTDISVDDNRLWSFSDSPLVHYGRQLIFKNLSILRTGFSGLPTSPQAPKLLAAAITHQEIPMQHAVGESLKLHVVVTNTGSAIWLFQTNNSQYGVRLGWRWIDRIGKDDFTEGRAPIRQDIFPGEREEFSIQIWPPSKEGKYILELGMVSEPEAWFDVQRFLVEIQGTCDFEDTINNPLKFIHERPNIAITADRPSYSEGEIAMVRLSIVNGAIPRNLKLSVFLRYPDGHMRSLSSSTEMLSNPACSQWMRTGAIHILSSEFRIDWQLGFQLRSIPDGLYILYAMMTDLRSAEVISKSSFTFYLKPTEILENRDELEKVSKKPNL